MDLPRPGELIERIRALAPGGILLERVRDRTGVYLVGGAVRDLLLGGSPLDLDLMVEGDAAAVAEQIGGTRVLHDRFGTCTVTAGGFTYDLARARSERYPSPGALPEVQPASAAEDLVRRDFTVNALAVALGGPEAGRLIAVEHALDDLAAARLRVLHAGSFRDDPTRLLRLARYAARLRFSVEPGTRRLVDGAVSARALGTVAGPRVGNELRLLSREQDPVGALLALGELGLDRALRPGFGLTGPEPLRRALALLPDDGRRDRLALGAAARGAAAETLPAWLNSLGFEAADRDAIVATATGADELAERLALASRPSEIALAVTGAPVEAVALAGAAGMGGAAQRWLEDLRHVALDIDGAELLREGVPQGPQIGSALAATLAAKLDGLVSGHESELAHALKAARGGG